MTISDSLARETGYAQSVAAVTGTPIDDSEHTAELAWPASIALYDKIRRDAMAKRLRRAITLPILARTYAIDPNGARREVVDHVAEDLSLPVLGEDTPRRPGRLRGRFSFLDHLRLSLLDLDYGHMPFEQVYEITGQPGSRRARLRKLAPRMPHSLVAINVARDGGLEGVEQTPDGRPAAGTWTSQPVKLGVDRLVMYVNDREGGNWQGNSIWREAYRPWLLKDRALRVHSVSIQRNGMGVPVAEGAQGMNDKQLKDLAVIAQAYRSGDAAGAATPAGSRIRLLGVEGTLPDTLGFIRYCDEEIAGLMLADFLKLGSTQSGTRAVGEIFLEQFEMAVDAVVAQQLNDVANPHIVEDIVDLNWDAEPRVPLIVAGEAPADVTAEAVATLLDAGAVTPDAGLEAWIRDQYRMPPRAATAPSSAPALAPAARSARAASPRQPRAAAAPALRREATAVEAAARTDFTAVQAAWEDSLSGLREQFAGVAAAQADTLVQQVRAAVDDGDPAALATLTADPEPAAAVIADVMLDVALAAAVMAAEEAREQGVALPDSAATGGVDATVLTAMARVVSSLLTSGLAAAAARKAMIEFGPGADPAAVEAAVREHLESLSGAFVDDHLGGALTIAQNEGRSAAFAAAPGDPVFFASEILDRATCDACESVDGQRFGSLDDARSAYASGGYSGCQGGLRCRGVVVAVYDEASIQQAA